MGGLRKYMPITAATFIVGWLAIAGVPPFAGFWSKDEILLFAYDANPALWAIGLVTALLTAYYMSRQVFMVFFGEERCRSERRGRARPSDAGVRRARTSRPWLMTLPLVVLAGLAIVGGVLNLPFTDDLHFLEEWLQPVLGENEARARRRHQHQGRPGGHRGARRRWSASPSPPASTCRSAPQPVEPEILAEAWYYDSTITAFMGGPGRQGFEAVAAFDRTVVDGAVNGVGRRRARQRQGPPRPPDRLRAQLRPRRGRRRRRPPRLLPHAGGRRERACSSSPARRRTASPPRRSPAAIVAAVRRRGGRWRSSPRPASSCTGSSPCCSPPAPAPSRSGCWPTSTPTTPASSTR